MNRDPDTERILKSQRPIKSALSKCEEICKNTPQSKQTLFTDFIPFQKGIVNVENVADITISKVVPNGKFSEFFVSDKDNAIPALSKTEGILTKNTLKE